MLPYAGIATFLRAPLVSLDEECVSDAAVLGVPFDIALGYRPGARFAPRAIRDASLRFAVPEGGFYDLQKKRSRLRNIRILDTGDVDLPTLEPQIARERIETAALRLRAGTQLPIFLGGDHSITYPILKAFREIEHLHVVQIDAHLDFTNERNGTRYSNSSAFRRAAEDLPNLEHIVTVGLRGLRFDQEAIQAAERRGHTLVPVWEMADDLSFTSRLPRGKNVYLSFDVDALDPSVFPATSSPEPDGLSYRSAVELIETVARHNSIVGCDLVEMTPDLDPSGNSAMLASRLILEILMAVFP